MAAGTRSAQEPQRLVISLTLLKTQSKRRRFWLSRFLGVAVASVALAATFWASAQPVQAVDSSIEVLSQSRRVEFPGRVSFSLTAKGDADIVEVLFFYRLLSSSVWSYAYPDFSPGVRVSANLDLSIAGPNYLPPGADLEYYYILRDARGNVEQTEPKLVEYTDHRYQWERAQIGGLQLLYHGLSPSRVDAVSRTVDGRIARILGLLDMDSFRPVKGVVYNNFEEAAPGFPNPSETLTEAQVFGGYAFPSSGVFVAIGFSPRIIVHETAHLLLDQALGRYALPVPAWLNEGFASYVEPGSAPYSGKSLSPGSLPLSAMNSVSGTPDEIPAFYRKAESVVAFMIDAFGVERFQHLLGELSQGRPVEEALLKAYGFGVSELDSRWASDGGGSSSPEPGRRGAGWPWVNFSGLVLAALAMTVLIAVSFRYVARRLRPTDNPEDRLQPWEDPDLLDDYDGR